MPTSDPPPAFPFFGATIPGNALNTWSSVDAVSVLLPASEAESAARIRADLEASASGRTVTVHVATA